MEAEKERANDSKERSKAKGGSDRKYAAPKPRAKAPLRTEERVVEEDKENRMPQSEYTSIHVFHPPENS